MLANLIFHTQTKNNRRLHFLFGTACLNSNSWNSEVFVRFHKFIKIPQILQIPQIPTRYVSLFAEFCNRVCRAGVFVVPVSFFLQALNFPLVASDV